MQFRVEALDDSHDVSGFRCEEPALEEFICTKARYYQSEHFCSVYLVISGDNQIHGFFTLSNAAVFRESLSKTQARKYRVNPVPSILIGQLARDFLLSKRGFGRHILVYAIREALKSHAWHLICADPFSDESRDWFLKNGFTPVTSQYPAIAGSRPQHLLQLYVRRKDVEALALMHSG